MYVFKLRMQKRVQNAVNGVAFCFYMRYTAFIRVRSETRKYTDSVGIPQ